MSHLTSVVCLKWVGVLGILTGIIDVSVPSWAFSPRSSLDQREVNNSGKVESVQKGAISGALSVPSKNEELILREMSNEKEKKSHSMAQKEPKTGALSRLRKDKWLKEFQGLDEKGLYGKVIEYFRAKNALALKLVSDELARRFPTSPQRDNALYLMGIMDLQKDAYVPALRNFEAIIKSYPDGNKRVSALFAKAVVYKRLNLLDQSESVLNQVIREYPGSPESQRAVLELRLLSSVGP